MRIAIVGATGAVGQEILKVLQQSIEAGHLEISELLLFASPRSAGQLINFAGNDITVQITPEGPIAADVVLVSAGANVSKKLAPIWAEAGAVVIDNSSAFRYDSTVPLVVPEVNGETALQHKGIIANPNCTTAIAAVAVAPIHRKYGIKRMIVSSYQATSGAGQAGMDELLTHTQAQLAGQEVTASAFVHPISFNVIPHIDAFQDNGYTKEEMKVTWEMQKILGDDSIKISCTAVRIPTLRSHSEAISLELAQSAQPDEVRELLAGSAGVEVCDVPADNNYPMPLTASHKYAVEVGRIRQSLVFEGGIELFVCGDQLLKGAALNAVQIVEYLQTQGAIRVTERA